MPTVCWALETQSEQGKMILALVGLTNESFFPSYFLGSGVDACLSDDGTRWVSPEYEDSSPASSLDKSS